MKKLIDEYLTPEETAAEIGVTRRTLINWQRNRTGPPISRIGHRTMYFKPSIVAWLRSREEANAA